MADAPPSREWLAKNIKGYAVDNLETAERLARLEVQMENVQSGIATLTGDVKALSGLVGDLASTAIGDRRFAKGIFLAVCLLWTVGTFIVPAILNHSARTVDDRVRALEDWRREPKPEGK